MDALPTTSDKVLITIDILMLIIGIACNGSVILIILTRRVSSGPRNYLLANLALGDLFLLLTSDLLGILLTFGVLDVNEEVVCLSVSTVIVVSQGVSVLTLTALSMDRFIAIVHPFAIMRLRPGKIYGTVVVLIWIISALVAAPIISIGEASNEGNYTYCYYVPHSEPPGIIYDCTRAVLFYAFPLLVICVSYVLMALKIFKSTAFAKKSSSSCKRVQKERQKLGILVLAIVVLFAVCWAPTTFYSIYRHYQFHNFDLTMILYFKIKLRDWSSTLVYINGCTNPIILYLMSRSYRECLVKFFCPDARKGSKFASMNTTLSSARSKTKFFRIRDGQELSELGKKVTLDTSDVSRS